MENITKNEKYTVTIESYSSEGFGVCRVKGRAVFVARALVGELWEIRIVKVTSSVVYARGETLLQPSPARISPLCPHFGRCGGCDTCHMSYEEELRFKLGRVNDALRHIGRQSVQAERILGGDRTEHYRNKAVFAVSEFNGQPAFGFYRERSHELIPIQSCALQSELSCRAAEAVVRFMRQLHLPAYDEESGKGTVRHIFFRQAENGHGAVLCIVSARGFGAHTQALVQALRDTCPELTGIVLNINKSRGNTILSGDYYTLWGSELIEDRLCGLSFSVSPQAFFQVNPGQTEKLYACAAEYASQLSPKLLVDLYCGAGTIGLCMARHAQRVIGAEIVPEAVENAAENARRNGIENAEFLCADAGEAARELFKRGLNADVVVVDPPRKGLDVAVIEAIAAMQPKGLVYVSCNPASLARDILRLNEFGYALRHATAVDMFPRTRHVETAALLSC